MPYFVVTYDLVEKNGEKRNYRPIEKALENLESCHTQDSVWYVDYDGTKRQLFDRLKTSLRDVDPLMVVEFDEKPYWRLGKTGTKAWVDERFG